VQEVTQAMSLKLKDEFLMHGVVLQNRVFQGPARDVSRETIFSSAAHHPSAARCFT
jgi:hypothetical protein